MKKAILILLMFLSVVVNAQNFDWTAQNSGVTSILNDVAFVDNQNGWAVGADGVILNTSNGGQSWSLQTSNITEVLRAVYFVDADTGWAVGGQLNRAMLKTTDGGANWESVNPVNISSNQMFDIAFFNTKVGWLITFDSIYSTTDGGDNWVKEAYVSNIESPQLEAITITSDTIAYVSGSSKLSAGTRKAEVLYRRPENYPNLWGNSYFNPTARDDRFSTIEFINSDIGFAGSKSGKLYKKTDFSNAASWEINFEIDDNHWIYSLSFPSETNGMFLTSTEISGVTNALIFHTEDGGDNWLAVPDTISDFLQAKKIHAPDETNAWVVGANGKIYKGVPAPITSIKQTAFNATVNIYPNPSTDLVIVEINSEKNTLVNYTLSDVSGRILEKGEWNLTKSNSKLSLNISDVYNGLYFLNLATGLSQSTFRVIKK